MPDFITLLRDIRDRMYVEMKEWYETVQAITVGSTTNIDPIDGVVQPATVTYDQNTNEFDFGIPTSPVIDNTDASLIRADGTVPMDTGYTPAIEKDVTTKEYVDGITYGWVQKFTTAIETENTVANTWGEGTFLVKAREIGATPTWDISVTLAIKADVYLSETLTAFALNAGFISLIGVVHNATDNFIAILEEVKLADETTTNTGHVVYEIWKWEVI